jgi:surface protein
MANILKIGDRVLKIGGRILRGVDPYNPLGLPPFTIRVKFSTGYTPSMGDSQTLVDSTENVWDITNNSTNWRGLFAGNRDFSRIIGANTTGVTNMSYMFSFCSDELEEIPLFDTRSVTNMNNMFSYCHCLYEIPEYDTRSCTDMSATFRYCTALKRVPRFNTSSVTNMRNMFESCAELEEIPLFDTRSVTYMFDMFSNCYNVKSGALALYQQVSSQATVPNHNEKTFYCCGASTTTGAAELAQIPSSWGGTGS